MHFGRLETPQYYLADNWGQEQGWARCPKLEPPWSAPYPVSFFAIFLDSAAKICVAYVSSATHIFRRLFNGGMSARWAIVGDLKFWTWSTTTSHATVFNGIHRTIANCLLNAGSGAENALMTTHGTTSREDVDSSTTNDAIDKSRTSHSDRNWSQCRRVARSLVGTPNYIAPEVLSQSGGSGLFLL